jgi:hypothetical protein
VSEGVHHEVAASTPHASLDSYRPFLTFSVYVICSTTAGQTRELGMGYQHLLQNIIATCMESQWHAH